MCRNYRESVLLGFYHPKSYHTITTKGEYVYDGDGKRLQVTEDSVTTTFIYSGCGILSFDIGEIPLWGPAYVVAAESDEGTVWALIETHCEIFSMQFTDQQYARDLQAIRNCQVKNGAIACGIGIVTGVGWVALRKKL
jgi:hypothetical protein